MCTLPLYTPRGAQGRRKITDSLTAASRSGCSCSFLPVHYYFLETAVPDYTQNENPLTCQGRITFLCLPCRVWKAGLCLLSAPALHNQQELERESH